MLSKCVSSGFRKDLGTIILSRTETVLDGGDQERRPRTANNLKQDHASTSVPKEQNEPRIQSVNSSARTVLPSTAATMEAEVRSSSTTLKPAGVGGSSRSGEAEVSSSTTLMKPPPHVGGSSPKRPFISPHWEAKIRSYMAKLSKEIEETAHINQKQNNPNLPTNDQKNLWTYWGQGIDQAPRLVRACAAKMQRVVGGGGWRVNVLSKGKLALHLAPDELT